MQDRDPLVVKGHYIIQLLSNVSDQTLKKIREDLGDETFANSNLIKVVEIAISNRKKKKTLEQFETVSIEEPDFWDS